LGFQHLLALAPVQIRGNELKGLVAVQPGVKLQELVRDCDFKAGQGLLKARQVLAHAIY
jgi:hypothetical protein